MKAKLVISHSENQYHDMSVNELKSKHPIHINY